jgi:tripartite-type tricarboxylate transporter receptor subunit TctC
MREASHPSPALKIHLLELGSKESEKERTMKKKPQPFMTLGILLAAFMLSALPAVVFAADAYPSKPVRLIIPMAPGGSTDIFARLVVENLSKRLGKQVVVDYRPGGGSVIGTEMVAKSDPDGYTLLFVGGSSATQPALQKLPYDPIKSFTPVAKLGVLGCGLFAHPSVPANTVKELIALVKQKPGQLIFTTSGVGSNAHMGAELFKMMAGIDFKIVHFKGGGPALIDTIGGHSDAFFSTIVTALSTLKSGRIKVLGTTGLKRSLILPDVPTLSESSLPGYELSQTYVMLGPAGMPTPIVDRLSKEVKEILSAEDVAKQLLQVGVEVEYVGPAGARSALEEEINKWVRVAKKANIKLEEE